MLYWHFKMAPRLLYHKMASVIKDIRSRKYMAPRLLYHKMASVIKDIRSRKYNSFKELKNDRPVLSAEFSMLLHLIILTT